jgi:isocitrate dehydrogenase
MSKAKEQGVLFSLHLKATMMKKSDPILFGHCVKVFYKDAFTKHAAKLAEIGVNANNGVGSVLSTIAAKAGADAEAILADFDACYAGRPDLFMCDSDKGITNLHVPSDVIIDASMPCIVRDGGTAWNKNNQRQETSACIPDRCYAGVYQAIFDYCRENGQFDVKTMGNVPNVGLMAQKAEEYGSHAKTFEMTAPGSVTVVDKNNNKKYLTHNVETGDIWRMCMTRDAPIQDWVKLAVARARATGSPAIFWLDPQRAHDRNIQSLAEKYLTNHDITGLEITFASPIEAAKTSFARMTVGKQTISVTGNVLRDYNTDLFPILELNTSAKMLSIVPMLSGGSMFETGAGGSAPLHVQQFTKENHLRWDSLGEYLATAAAFEFLGERGNTQASLLGKTLNESVCRWLDEDKTPKRRVNEPDNRAANFYLALFWA